MGQGVMEDTYSDRLDIMACCKGDYSLYNRCGQHRVCCVSTARVCPVVLGKMRWAPANYKERQQGAVCFTICGVGDLLELLWAAVYSTHAWYQALMLSNKHSLCSNSMHCWCVHAGSCLAGCQQQSVLSYRCRTWQRRPLVGASSTSRCGPTTGQSLWGSSRV